jgi:hypothetical protein
MKKYRILLVLIITSLIGSCSSPIDLDTERKVVPVVPIKKIICQLDSATIKMNNVEQELFELPVASKPIMEVDTTYSNSFVKMRVIMTNPSSVMPSYPSIYSKIIVTEFCINLDSIEFSSSPIKIIGGENDKAYTSFKIFRVAKDSTILADTTIYTNTGRNYSEITFSSPDKEKRTIWSFLNTWIYDWKYTSVKINGLDSLIREPDSLNIQAGFRFKF